VVPARQEHRSVDFRDPAFVVRVKAAIGAVAIDRRLA
jgi:hypothetical protein